MLTSLRRLDLATLAVSVLGVAVSAYLTWVHFSGSLALCTGVGGCEVVQASAYSMLLGVPVALIGLLGYLAIGGLLVAALLRPGTPGISPLLFGFSLAGLAFSLYLTWVEVAILGALCPWCVASQLIIAMIFVLSLLRIRLAP